MSCIRRGSAILERATETVLRAGDVVVIGARRHVLLAEGSPFGEEVEDRELLDFPIVVLDVVVTNNKVADRRLAELAEEHGRGVGGPTEARPRGEEIPYGADTEVNRGDLLRHLLGACAGAGTVTAALRAIQDEAGSKLPVLGYTVPYAIGNILLTTWGPVVVMLTR